MEHPAAAVNHQKGAIVFFRNINNSRPMALTSLLPYRENRIISHSILNWPRISMVLFAMDEGEEISEETEPGAGWLRVLEGAVQVTMGNKAFLAAQGSDIVIPPGEPHGLQAFGRCKYLQISIEEDSAMDYGTFIKKIPVKQAVTLSDLIEYEAQKISSISLVQRKDLLITLFALDQGEEMGGHASTGDAMVDMLEGTAQITIGGEPFTVAVGQSIIMPANIEHSLRAVTPYKMLLTVVKP